MLEDRSLAKDVVQSTFLAVWRRAETFQPEWGNVRAWIFSIVRHRVIDVTGSGLIRRERLSIDDVKVKVGAPDPWHQFCENFDREQVSYRKFPAGCASWIPVDPPNSGLRAEAKPSDRPANRINN